MSEEAGFFAIGDTTALEEVSLFENKRTVTPGSLRDEGKPCG
jgi:hypothetical protein